ncbi:MAG: TolC family protein [Planctomycetota bacterium]|nr:TolC family protein [Planctomycetota bacterium]
MPLHISQVMFRVRVALGGGALLVAAGCRTYEPRPLDLDGARAAWLARSPSDNSVREFAASLARRPDDPTFHPADGLTLGEGEVVALVFNADLRRARLEAGVIRATADHAGLWHDPVLGVDLERVVANGGGANPWVVAGTLGLTVPISGRLDAEKARAGAELAAELEEVAALEWATRAALRELWVEWSAASVRREVGARYVTALREVAGLAEAQESAGSLTRLEARAFRVELAAREADQIALDARARELEIQLRAMMGLAPGAAADLVPTVAFAFSGGEDDDGLRTALERSSPELASVRARYEAAEASLRTEVRKQYPDLVLGPGYGRDQGDDRVLLGLQVPVPLWNRNRQGVAEAEARRESARTRFETTYEHLASRLAVALVRHAAGRAQREWVESAVVPLADEQEADARRVAALGRVDTLLLLASLQAQHAARVRLIDARAAEAIGAIRVAELIGPPPVEPRSESVVPSESRPAPSN